ncbi:lipoprotein signal peptidase [Ectothiorhodospiraceae bacterium BW-2]|nr:lipoprotein signal peptidase [Ectothiorhodospiraceae bacterium BW-2]
MMLKYLLLTLLVLILDQWTKQLATAHLLYATPVEVIPSLLNWTLLHNTGAAFSFLSDAGGWQRWLFATLAIAISAIMLLWLSRLKSHQHWLAIALALILGGAIGNLWDRLALGYVVDFIDIYYQQWHWPAFNIADSAISLGAVMLIIDTFRQQDDKSDEGGQ